ncbi:MAG: peptidoglycan-binding protein [Roseovarius sp.]|nr:peptidoglycan-binding protein [Roseovarius sp.]
MPSSSGIWAIASSTGWAISGSRWDRTAPLTRRDVAAIQRGLGGLGHDTGGVDGLAGFKTRRAIGLWQRANGRRETCFPEDGMAAALGR